MSGKIVGVIHPGQMGAAVGEAMLGVGAKVVWASAGRSGATKLRAQEAGLSDVGDVRRLTQESEIIISVCPPHAALDAAREIFGFGFSGIYVEANAISPERTKEIGKMALDVGATFIDGGIIGPPPKKPGTTRLYLSSDEEAGDEEGRGEVARDGIVGLFEGTNLEAIAIEGGVGAASALKMAYAAYMKGNAALLLAVRALARREGVEDDLIAEWKRSIPELPARSEALPRLAAAKAWRFVGEMEEIAATFEGAGLPSGFHEGARDIYDRLAGFANQDDPGLDDVLGALLGE